MLRSGSYRWFPLIAGLSALTVGASCTGGSSPGASGSAGPLKGNQAPAITSARILNDPIPLTGPVAVQVEADDPEREAVSFQYQWYVDNVPLPKQTDATLPAEILRRGQTVMVEIVPTDGTHRGQPYRTKPILVGNTSPKIISISFTPLAVRPGDKIEAQVEAADPDHDRVDLTYKWFRNDAVIQEGEEPFLDTAGLASGDRIVVEVTAHDPAKSGSSLRSDALVLGNSAPTIVSSPPAPGAPDRFEYAVRAVDPDGDRLTYQLESAPPGMTISEASGQIAWSIPADQRGTFHVKVVARDGRGGMASQEFDLTLTAASSAKPAEA
ncbi:MAG TPA: Ig domain-containing protein [Nitrospira sp.]|nr:Ig domain-containing protein [Nitrospira sp.]